jgi:hypothetical protein
LFVATKPKRRRRWQLLLPYSLQQNQKEEGDGNCCCLLRCNKNKKRRRELKRGSLPSSSCSGLSILAFVSNVLLRVSLQVRCPSSRFKRS